MPTNRRINPSTNINGPLLAKVLDAIAAQTLFHGKRLPKYNPAATPTPSITKVPIINKKKILNGGQNAEIKYRNSPAMTSTVTMYNGVQTMVVEKTEAIQAVTAIGTSYKEAFINFYPQSPLVPWLASISKSFAQYQILELEFTYVPGVPTTQAGVFMVAFAGDYNDIVPTTQEGFLQSEQSLMAPVYAGTEGGRALQYIGFPPGDVVGFSVPKYTYSLGSTNTPETYRIVSSSTFNTTLANQERNFYSPGRLIYALNGVKDATPTTTLTVGQLFVRYKIRLLGSVKPEDNA